MLFRLSTLLLLSLFYSSKLMSQNRPNIIFITSDSHRKDALGANDHPFVKTPNLDKMAKEGANFKEAYVTTAICVVSRASILTGQHVARHQINDFGSIFSEEAMEQTYPLLLKKAGYKIAQIGFLGVGKDEFKDKFDHWDTHIPWMNKENIHQTDQISSKTQDFLSKQNKNQPFYLAISFEAAHEIDGSNGKPATYLIQDRYKNLYKEKTIEYPKSSNSEYFQQLPDFLRSDKNIARGRWQGFFSNEQLHQENSRNYYRLITGIDEAIGKIKAKLESLGLDKNTIIIYTSDHGFSLSEHGFMGKWTGFETAIHVPLIIQDLRTKSKFNKGTRKNMVLNIDLAPTILNFAGISVPSNMQGFNIFTNKNNRKKFFYEHSILGSPMLPKVEGIITKEFKYLYYPEKDFEFLFDRKKDPEELKNLAKDPKAAKLLAKAKKEFNQEKENAK